MTDCCGADCDYRDHPSGPCWGNVSVCGEVMMEDGDCFWVHACRGHRELFDGLDGDGYQPKPAVKVGE